MPEEVRLELVIPAVLGPRAQVIDELRARVTEVERRTHRERVRTGARVLGRRRVLTQAWQASPRSIEPRRTLRPRFAGALAVRIPALVAFKEFLACYREARVRWVGGLRCIFPTGTFWLARGSPAQIAPPIRD